MKLLWLRKRRLQLHGNMIFLVLVAGHFWRQSKKYMFKKSNQGKFR